MLHREYIRTDGTKQRIAPRFDPRGLLIVNRTDKDVILQGDDGEEYFSPPNVASTWPVSPTSGFLAYTAGAITNDGHARIVVDSNPAALSTSQLAELASGGSGSSATPTGTVLAFAGLLAPTGYVVCDGSLYNGTDPLYTPLWNVLGNTFGGGSQVAFAVPDLRGRSVFGLGTHADVNALTDNDALAVGSRRPAHRHTVTDPTHNHGMNVDNGGALSGTVRPAGAGNTNSAAVNNLGNVAAATGISVGPAGSALDGPSYQVLNYVIAL